MVFTHVICSMKVRVGCGGSKNFMQHRGLPACLKIAKKGNLKPKAGQTKTIHSYFTKATQGGTSQGTSEQTEQGTKQGMERKTESHPRPHPTQDLPFQHQVCGRCTNLLVN